MHLQSSKSIASRSSLVSKILTNNSGIRPPLTLTPMIVDSSSDTESNFIVTKIKASFSMGDFANSTGQTDLHMHVKRVRFDTKLVFAKENKYGAKLYRDYLDNYTVTIEDIQTPFELEVMANYQGDHYMGVNGTKYLIMPMFDDMDPTRKVHHIRVQIELIMGNFNMGHGQ